MTPSYPESEPTWRRLLEDLFGWLVGQGMDTFLTHCAVAAGCVVVLRLVWLHRHAFDSLYSRSADMVGGMEEALFTSAGVALGASALASGAHQRGLLWLLLGLEVALASTLALRWRIDAAARARDRTADVAKELRNIEHRLPPTD
jgi:hypothetical protein